MTARSLEERQARDLLRKAAKAKAPKQKMGIGKAKQAWSRPVLPKRPKLTDAQKQAIHAAHHGLCYICEQPCPVLGPEVQYDHKQERWEDGADTADNLGPAHTVPCHARKTARKMAERGHVDRMGRKNAGDEKPKGRKIQSAGFDNIYRPMASTRR